MLARVPAVRVGGEMGSDKTCRVWSEEWRADTDLSAWAAGGRHEEPRINPVIPRQRREWGKEK